MNTISSQAQIDPNTGLPIQDANMMMGQNPNMMMAGAQMQDPNMMMGQDPSMNGVVPIDPNTGMPMEQEPPLDSDTSIVRHYMTKPNGATAIQFLQVNLQEVIEFCNDGMQTAEPLGDGTIKFTNTSGSKIINVGDYVVRDRSRCSIVPPDAFALKYLMIGDMVPEQTNVDTSNDTLAAISGDPIEGGVPADPTLDQGAVPQNFSIAGIIIKKYLQDSPERCNQVIVKGNISDLSKSYNSKYTDGDLERDIRKDIEMYLSKRLADSNSPSDQRIAANTSNLAAEVNKSLANNIHPDFMNNEPSQTLMASCIKPIGEITSVR